MVPPSKPVSYSRTFSRTWSFFEGEWHEGHVPIRGPRIHGLYGP
jgi:branched-chain amino acid aminotransferase